MNKLFKLEQVTIEKRHTIRQTMQKLDKSKYGFYIVLDEKKKIIGTVTDGDIRRSILKGLDINISIIFSMNKRPKILRIDNLNKYERIFNNLKGNNKFLPVINVKEKIEFVLIEGKKDINRTALIMAGGFGKRLGAKTKNLPKPLIKIGNNNILEKILSKLEKQNYKNIFISTYYLHKKINRYLEKRKNYANIEIIRESTPLGTAGSISFLKKVKFESLTVINADIVFDVHLDAFNNFHEEKKNDITIMVAKYKYQIPFGVIKYDKNFRFKSSVEKPIKEELVLSGIYCLSKSVCNLVEKKFTTMPELIETAEKLDRKISIFPIHEYWNDIGNPSSLKNEILREKIKKSSY